MQLDKLIYHMVLLRILHRELIFCSSDEHCICPQA